MWEQRWNGYHIISESSKLAKKEYKTRQVWVWKVFRWKLCKRLKFNHTNELYIYKSESALENETHKIICELELQTDYLIPARSLDLVLINKKKELAVK